VPSAEGLPVKSLKFVLVGGANTGLMYFLYWVLVRLGVHYNVALFCDYGVGILVGYLVNRHWTFANHGRPRSGLLKYTCAYVAVYLVNMILLTAIVESNLSGPLWGQVIAMTGATALAFTLQNFWVFRRHHATEETVSGRVNDARPGS